MNIEQTKKLSFSDALEHLKFGNRVARAGWAKKGVWVEIQMPDENSKMTRSYIYMNLVGGDLVPWIPSQLDVMAEDWIALVY